MTLLSHRTDTGSEHFARQDSGSRGGRGDSHIKRGGMLVVSLRGVTFGFWSHLGCSGQNAIICSREGLL